MRVFINDKPIEIFEGARVCDALNKYFSERNMAYDPSSMQILDYHKNIIFGNGSLSEYDRIFINELSKSS